MTLNISSSILSKDLPAISETSFKKIEVLPIPTVLANPTEIAVVIPNGLWIMLSIVIKLLIVAFSDGTDKVWVFPIPVVSINDTAIPALAKVAEIATLMLSWSSLIAKRVDGNKVVTPIPGTSVDSITIADWPTYGL